jgi:hypothetical protein
LKPLVAFVFVFGSNLAGQHGAGAALTAAKERSFPRFLGVGFANGCYAIPTKDCNIITLPIHVVSLYVLQFKNFAEDSSLSFQVTRVGCGLAGLKEQDMANLFVRSPRNVYFDKAWEPFLGDHVNYWGTFP